MSLNTAIAIVQYSWWAYEWVYKPFFTGPLVQLNWSKTPRSETRTRDDTEIHHQLQRLSFELSALRENHFNGDNCDKVNKVGKKVDKRRRNSI